MKISNILGLNARSYFSYNYNKPGGKKIASSKLRTKRALSEADIPVPRILVKLRKPQDILRYDWDLPEAFALKPSKGLGGEGIIVVKKRAKDPSTSSGQAREGWITTDKRKVTTEDLKLHVLDILEGAYSLGNVPDVAFIEEYVGRHKAFRKYAYSGTPDIRVIVFNKVPVISMLRLPTRESGGRANLHQGAIGVGIDIATGITTKAMHYGKQIKFKPDTRRKLHGIKIPYWTKILELSVRCAEAADLGYVGVDVVLHPERGPQVLEINSQPGLGIQLASEAGLKKRLERIEDLEVSDAEHGVRIAKALFASHFADRVRAEEGIRTLEPFEAVRVLGRDKKKVEVKAKIDTGAWRTSIDQDFAEELGLLEEDNVLWRRRVRSAMGKEERPVIGLTFWLGGKKVKTISSVAQRHGLRYKLIIGRKDLKGFLVEPRPGQKS